MLPEAVLIDLMIPPTRGESVTDFRDSKRAIYSLSSRTRSEVALPTSTSGGGNPPVCAFEPKEHEAAKIICIKSTSRQPHLLKIAKDRSITLRSQQYALKIYLIYLYYTDQCDGDKDGPDHGQNDNVVRSLYFQRFQQAIPSSIWVQ
jgi:hypothetical protein